MLGRTFGLPACVVAALVLAGGAPAQEALSLLEAQPDGPLVSEDEVRALTRLVELTPEQEEVVSTLREGLAADFKAASRHRQAAQDAAQSDSQDRPRADQERAFADAGRQFRDKCAELERGFLLDVKGILTPRQAEHWPGFERYRRRIHSKGWWKRPAADADLVKVVGGLKLEAAQAAAVQPVLDEYERELDPAVIARMALQREAASLQFGDNYLKQQGWYARAYDQSQQVDQRLAGINRKYARLLKPLLPPARQEEFQAGFAAACFINLYTLSDDRRKINAAEKLSGLSDQQKADLEQVIAPFRREVAAAEKDAERLEEQQAYQYTYQQISDGKEPKGYEERYNAIWALEAMTLTAARKVLTEEQREKIDSLGGD